ncbi:hypothetical protein Taro_004895 [Colocasia esculenta]|uniref:Uncharacterized protein n=1 Tax=Colocasia esculenta TaxID=4460 RepID=A0A843TT26_COLES|nr:hypothetical protein [Colocasia esculenta]
MQAPLSSPFFLFLLSLLLFTVGELPLPPSQAFGHGGGAGVLVAQRWSSVEQGGGGQSDVKCPNGGGSLAPLFRGGCRQEPVTGKQREWLLFQFIAYHIGLISNPFGSSDPWVAARPSGSLARVLESSSAEAKKAITQRTQEIYPGSDILPIEDLRLVPKQTLGISLTEGTVPFKDTTTPWIPHQVFFSFPAGQKSFLEKKDQTESYYKMNTKDLAHSHRLSPKITMSTGRMEEKKA